MKKLTCIAIDDEPIALLIIRQFCERKGGLELTAFSERLSDCKRLAGANRIWFFWILK